MDDGERPPAFDGWGDLLVADNVAGALNAIPVVGFVGGAVVVFYASVAAFHA